MPRSFLSGELTEEDLLERSREAVKMGTPLVAQCLRLTHAARADRSVLRSVNRYFFGALGFPPLGSWTEWDASQQADHSGPEGWLARVAENSEWHASPFFWKIVGGLCTRAGLQGVRLFTSPKNLPGVMKVALPGARAARSEVVTFSRSVSRLLGYVSGREPRKMTATEARTLSEYRATSARSKKRSHFLLKLGFNVRKSTGTPVQLRADAKRYLARLVEREKKTGDK